MNTENTIIICISLALITIIASFSVDSLIKHHFELKMAKIGMEQRVGEHNKIIWVRTPVAVEVPANQ